jgi:very-short-patch-repair endonuclease
LPALNVVIAGHEVDALWEDARLVVELDSRSFHNTVAAFERDRKRDMDLQLAGYRVLRITHTRLRLEPEAVVHAIRRLLVAG